MKVRITMKKKMMIILSLLFVMGATGCNSEQNPLILTTTISLLEENESKHTKQMHEFDTAYTIGFQNSDGTYSMYVFAAPIQFRTATGYEIIDNTVVESEKENFAFENKANHVKAFFPNRISDPFRVELENRYLEMIFQQDAEGFLEARPIIFTNMHGDNVSAVIYEGEDMDIVLYPTRAGIKSEVILRSSLERGELAFQVSSSSPMRQNRQNGYVLFINDEEDIDSVIYTTIIQYGAENNIDLNTSVDVQEMAEDYIVTMQMDENVTEDVCINDPMRLEQSFEMYLDKIPDTTVYSRFHMNNFLNRYAVVGYHPILGEGWHYFRLRIQWFMLLNPEAITRATYNIRVLSHYEESPLISLMQMHEQWESVTMLWHSRKQQFSHYADAKPGRDQYLRYDITDFVKGAFADHCWMTESMGFMLKSQEKDAFAILATSDNSLYPTYLRIDMSELPIYFDRREDINPEDPTLF